MTYTQFTAQFAANKNNIPAAIRAEIVREARARSMQPRANGPVLWNDLIERIESAISPR